ncbi:sugar O-acetyltransferase [Schleiferilactobacillus perolens]|uniref:Acetyltransferase n=1 Tax=Schleiferilactobacillus perolens DSM 12744 TaxID=1423792 RepID=A0A0R1N179_9LACO|nr:sugar O-acetyltransferase [Schleiferilactobacillus perolens]KRL11130.1 galactose-6-phosphate isomerase LacA subunit [Schleiferilactobacillus perolens DSM 12744]
MSESDKMHSGELYLPGDDAIAQAQQQALEKLYDYNHTRPSERAKRQALLQEMFATIGSDCYLEPPFHANWAGRFVHFGNHIYANFNLTLVDDTRIDVGDHVMFGPNVTLATAAHPVLPALREKEYQYNVPIKIGENAWLGAGVVVLPGVSIGANTVIGAGSVITKDIPANVVAFGNPCEVHRPINKHDQTFYYKQHQISI